MHYRHSILGGTFDRLHAGHKAFIDAAEIASGNVTIGLVSDEFLGDRVRKDIIEPYSLRKQNLEDYLNLKQWFSKTTIIPLKNIYGNSLEKRAIDAVFAIDESLKNAKLINKARREKGLPQLIVEIVPMVKAADGGFISSKRIRSGEINREGSLYLDLFKQTLKLPNNLRNQLKKPFGDVISDDTEFEKLAEKQIVITVGDIATYKMIETGRIPNLSVYDTKTARRDIRDKKILNLLPKPTHLIKNAPGTISHKAASAINESLRNNKQAAIKVTGEEDLLTLPTILLAPLESIVIYGIPGIGGVKIKITEEIKEKTLNILRGFTIV